MYRDAQHPEPPPSGRQVVEAFHAEMTVQGVNKQLENSPARVDDRRAARPQPAPPQRSYMQVPWRR